MTEYPTSLDPLGRAFSAEWRDETTGSTDLHWAAALDRPDAVAVLVEAGVAPDVRLKDDGTPFGESLQRRLAELGLGDAFTDGRAAGETPAMIAALANSRPALARLISLGARSDNDRIPLHAAAFGNAVDAALLLAEQGADIDARDNDGRTPLRRAEEENPADVARLLAE